MSKTTNQLYTILTSVIGLSLLILVAYRACDLSITFDEVWTYDLANQSILDIMTAERNFTSANNHILNSIFIKPVLNLFGHHIWVLRLPNVLSYIIYFIASVLIARAICKEAKLQLIAILILNLHPYLLDFFSLSRGYGIALSFETLSLAWIFIYFKKKKLKYIISSFSMASLAVLANFTWLNFLLPLWAAINFIFIIHNIQSSNKIFHGFFRNNIIPFLFSILVASFSIIPILYLRRQDEFKWGANAWFDSFHSFAKDFNYSNSFLLAILIQVLIMILFSLSFYILFKQYLKKQPLDLPILLFASIISFIILATITQRFLLHSMYMNGRKATMYIPLLMSLMIAVISHYEISYRKIYNISFGIGFATFVHFVLSFNMHSVREWWFDADTKQVITFIDRQTTDSTIAVNMNWQFTSSFEYYNRFYFNNKFLVTKIENSEINSQSPNYFYVFEDKIPTIPPNYSIIKSHKFLYALMKRKELNL